MSSSDDDRLTDEELLGQMKLAQNHERDSLAYSIFLFHLAR